MKYLPIGMLDNIAFWTDEEEKIWNSSCRKYEKHFDSIRHLLPQDFYHFNKNVSLHDYRLESYVFIDNKKQVDLEMIWKKDDDNCCKITFFDVDHFEFKNPSNRAAEYICGEVTKNKKKICFECLLAYGGHIKFLFQTLIFSRRQ